MQLANLNKRNSPTSYGRSGMEQNIVYNNRRTPAHSQESVQHPVMSVQNSLLGSTLNASTNSIGFVAGTPTKGTFKTIKEPFNDVRVAFNICGEKFEVLESTLQRYPNTLLGDVKKRSNYWDKEENEVFLDRNRACFESVLTYYQTNGILIKPTNIPDVVFLQEVQFYELGDDVCQKVKGIEEETDDMEHKEKSTPENQFQRKVWDLFENPETSKSARTIAWLSCTIVLVSIVLFCVETLPQFQHEKGETTQSTQIFFTLEAVCIAWFTFEYLVRLCSSPNKWRFVREPLNVIDLVAILPFFMAFALNSQDSSVSSMAILRAVRLVRVFRIFKLSRYSTGLQILGMTLRASLSELGLLVFFLSVGVILFASAIYYAEMNVEDGKFHSIPHSFWWAIVTMTTVGYGDMYPTTLAGKMIGSACACTGILAIALPVPVIVANFERFYSKATNNSPKTERADKKAAKYKALKRFFDRIRQRNHSNNNDLSEDEYYDMQQGLSPTVETKESYTPNRNSYIAGNHEPLVSTSNV